MKTALLIACAGLALTGCSTDRTHGTPAVEVVAKDQPVVVSVEQPHKTTVWERWHYDNHDTNPDRLSAQIPLDPLFPPAPVRDPDQ
ncbi:MAG: hypothetical protein JWQ71_4829 [Pedosphaera sp.]|nr:hypothetical protein [Pedosphaera sp.]